jgi:glucose/arabinose dehydrogenase
MQKHILLFLLVFSTCLRAQTPQFKLTEWATNFDRPVDIAHCGDSRLFIVEQQGFIWVVDSLGKRQAKPFLNIDPQVNSNSSERGLLGLAFHPNYAQNGWFFVNYTKSDGDTRISRFSVSPTNPDSANPNSELIILEVDQPFANHNGGGLKFGPDGYLYIGLGDGGSGGDPLNNSQNTNILLGKFLRLDVSNASVATPYTIPPDNPFIGKTNYRPEIWSVGWRNPWRFSFDRLTGDLWVGDVGQNAREEIDFEPAKTPGLNYGWRCREGSQNYNSNGCQSADAYIYPVFTYANPAQGCSVTGGFVYRGSKWPAFYGLYVFPDYCSGRWWILKRQSDGLINFEQVADLTNGEFSSLGEDRDGELYATGYSSGKIYKISYGSSVATQTPADVMACTVTPNPGKDQFVLHLTLAQNQRIQLSLTNMQGKTVLTQQHEGQYFTLPIDVGMFPAEPYYLNVVTQKGKLVRLLIKI